MIPPPLLSLQGVCFSYGGPFALKDVSCEVREGDMLAVLGPNGGGKSTLLKLMAGLLRPASGRVSWRGEGLAGCSARQISQRIAVLPQDASAASMFPLTVAQTVSLGLYARSEKFGWRNPGADQKVEEALEEVGLAWARDRLFTDLSGGERRRALLARALAQEPALILLDEPTSHLDPRHQVELAKSLNRRRREKGTAVVAVLHDVNLAVSWCPRLLALKEGRVAAEGPAEETAAASLWEDLYGVRPDAMRHASGQRFDFYSNLD